MTIKKSIFLLLILLTSSVLVFTNNIYSADGESKSGGSDSKGGGTVIQAVPAEINLQGVNNIKNIGGLGSSSSSSSSASDSTETTTDTSVYTQTIPDGCTSTIKGGTDTETYHAKNFANNTQNDLGLGNIQDCKITNPSSYQMNPPVIQAVEIGDGGETEESREKAVKSGGTTSSGTTALEALNKFNQMQDIAPKEE